jgi:predicted DNA-binding transcriptional regulator AlpA
MSKKQPAKEILTLKEVCNHLNISMATLYRACFDTQKLPRVRISQKRVGVLRTDLDEYIKNQRA